MNAGGIPLRRETSDAPDHRYSESGLDRKCEWILEREWDSAHRAALQLVDRPQLSVWMIIIPIVFLHFMYRAQKFKSGLASIRQELFTSREFAMKLARDSVLDVAPDPDPSEYFPDGAATRMSAQLREAEINLSKVLVRHYRRLLQAQGESYAELVCGAYGDEARYRKECLDRLAEAEDRIAVFARTAAADIPEAVQMLATLDAVRRELRDEDVSLCFVPPHAV